MSTNTFNPNGAEYIRSLIAEAVENGSRTATVKGNYIISEAVGQEEKGAHMVATITFS